MSISKQICSSGICSLCFLGWERTETMESGPGLWTRTSVSVIFYTGISLWWWLRYGRKYLMRCSQWGGNMSHHCGSLKRWSWMKKTTWGCQIMSSEKHNNSTLHCYCHYVERQNRPMWSLLSKGSSVTVGSSGSTKPSLTFRFVLLELSSVCEEY